MTDQTRRFLQEKYQVSEALLRLHDQALADIQGEIAYYDEVREYNQLKVLHAFQEERISESMFGLTTGYGYGDLGREKLDALYARVFGANAALVRPHFVNGTHAISCALFGNLRPGDTLLTVTGRPYDTLHQVIGIGGKNPAGSLKDLGIFYQEIDLLAGGLDFSAIATALEDPSIKMVHLQRSTGYSWRPSLSIATLREGIAYIKSLRSDIIVFVDNCYGEFVETLEPTQVGADLMAGSLIKNPGGSIAPTGGYIAGREDLVEHAAYRLTVPGIGGECGSTFGVTRLMFQGFFLSPLITMEAVKSAVFAARLMECAGFCVKPSSKEKRTDIIQAIRFGEKEPLIRFVKGIQYGAPVDSFVSCEPWAMPGYEDPVIMASGAFIQGSSIELSCDAPIREPYIAYLQGGITFDHARMGILTALAQVLEKQ
ncbi:Aluminum resistance protein [Clostridiaceae bacterium JG1575]|nr:Aluminum resistance protein [Clostridiaceae bacterium JG1575]